jgi:hypothetical protein
MRLALERGMNTSPRIPDDATDRDLETLVAEALDAVLTVEWHEGRLRLRVTPPAKPHSGRIVLRPLRAAV